MERENDWCSSMSGQSVLNHWFFLIGGIGLIAASILPFRVARGTKNFDEVPPTERPAWSYMPPWYHRTLGLAMLAGGAFFLYMFFQS